VSRDPAKTIATVAPINNLQPFFLTPPAGFAKSIGAARCRFPDVYDITTTQRRLIIIITTAIILLLYRFTSRGYNVVMVIDYNNIIIYSDYRSAHVISERRRDCGGGGKSVMSIESLLPRIIN